MAQKSLNRGENGEIMFQKRENLEKKTAKIDELN